MELICTSKVKVGGTEEVLFTLISTAIVVRLCRVCPCVTTFLSAGNN